MKGKKVMKTMKNKIGVLLMVIVLVFTVPYGTAAADSFYSEQGKIMAKNGDTGCSWRYNYQTKVLTISGKGRLHGTMEETIKESAEKIVIKEGITSIGKNFFSGCAMKSIRLPKSLTKIESGAFSLCISLENIAIPKNVKTLGSGVFEYCENLKSITILGNLEKLNGPFFYVPNLQTLKIAGKCNQMGKMLYYTMSDKVRVKVINNNPYYVEKGGFVLSKDGKKLYYYNGGKKQEQLPEQVTSIEIGACSGKTIQFTLNKNLKRIKYGAFSDCIIKELIVPDGMERIDSGAFSNATIKKIVFGKGLKQIADSAFENADVEKAVIQSNVKLGKNNFSDGTVLEFQNGAKMKTIIQYCDYRIRRGKKDEVVVTFAKVTGADGYQIKVFQPDKKKAKYYDVKKTEVKIRTKFSIQTVEDEWDDLEYDNCEEVYVRVRPYKNVNGKKVYGDWSKRMLAELY